jgi:ketosteroid isomerase-like protein
MPEESTTPDLVERWRGGFDAINSGDIDAAMGVWGPDPVWDMSPIGLGVYEGATAIRGFWEDWTGTYEDWEAEPVEVFDLGGGVTLAVVIQKGRIAGSSSDVRLRYASVAVWVGGLIVRITSYGDVDEARAAAERLAESRAWAMSQDNVELEAMSQERS